MDTKEIVEKLRDIKRQLEEIRCSINEHDNIDQAIAALHNEIISEAIK